MLRINQFEQQGHDISFLYFFPALSGLTGIGVGSPFGYLMGRRAERRAIAAEVAGKLMDCLDTLWVWFQDGGQSVDDGPYELSREQVELASYELAVWLPRLRSQKLQVRIQTLADESNPDYTEASVVADTRYDDIRREFLAVRAELRRLQR